MFKRDVEKTLVFIFTRPDKKFLKLNMSIGVPIKLLHEAEGHIVTLETTTGEIYRGKLLEAEDNMNCQLQSVTVTARNGQVCFRCRKRSC